MATKPKDRRRTVPVTPSDEHPIYRPGERLLPEKPGEELRELAGGRAARTPFTLHAALAAGILGVAAIVVGIVVLAIWLA
jgi:hypothetical protein